MRYESDHKQKTRDRVLKEAARAIRAEGPHRIAVAGVMAKAGLTHGGFYAHFKSKDDLVAAAIDAMFVEAKSRFSREIGDRSLGNDPAGSLVAYIDFYLSAAHRDARTTGCPLPALAADLPRLEPASRERYGQGVAALTELMSRSLRDLGRTDAEPLARSALNEMVGALSLSRAVADPLQSDLILDASRTALKRRLGLEPAQ